MGVDAREVPEQPVAVEEKATAKPKEDPRELKLRVMLEKPLVDGQNHVGTLLEICQALEWEMPAFEFEEREDGFYCRCFCDGGVGDAISGKKKLSKQRAAMDVLQKLKKDP